MIRDVYANRSVIVTGSGLYAAGLRKLEEGVMVLLSLGLIVITRGKYKSIYTFPPDLEM